MSDILTRYDTSLDGLSSSEAEKRQKEYGLNEIAEKPPTPLYILFLSQFVGSDNPCGYAECDYGIYPGVQITKGH